VTSKNLYFKNEFCSDICSHCVKLESQNVSLTLKHPVLLNVCHHTFVQFFIIESLVRYINDTVSYFLPWNITGSVIDFMLFRTQYQLRNRKRNTPICSMYGQLYVVSTNIMHSAVTSLTYSYSNGLCFTAAPWKVGNIDFITLCMKLHDAVSPARLSFFRQPSVSTRSGNKFIGHWGKFLFWHVYKIYEFSNRSF
jgi:hypothetical protein